MNREERNLNTFLSDNIHKFWPLISFLIFFYGYIGFNYYLSYNYISFVEIDIRMLISFGIAVSIYNLLCVLSAYAYTMGLLPIVYLSIVPVSILYLTRIEFTPLVAFTMIIIFGGIVDIIRRRLIKTLKALKENKKEEAQKIERKASIIDFLLFAAFGVVLLFQYYGYALFYLFTIYYIILINDAIVTPFLRTWIISGLLLVSLLATALYGFLIAGPFGFPLAGIKKYGVTVEMEGSTQLKGVVIYQNTNTLYLRMEESGKKSDVEISKSFVKKQTRVEAKIEMPPSLAEIAVDWYMKRKSLKGKEKQGAEMNKKSSPSKGGEGE